MTAPSLPDGTVVDVHPHATIDGTVLVVGSPPRAARVSERLLADGTQGLVVGPRNRRALDRLVELDLAVPRWSSLPEVSASELTVVIPAFGRSEALGRTLDVLGPRLEVIVVDDASPDPAPVRRVTEEHGARLVRLDRNRGPAAARNAGLAVSTTRLVAFVDSDVDVDATTLLSLARHHADPGLALSAPRVMSRGGTGVLARYDAAGASLDRSPAPGLLRLHTPLSWVPGACIVANAELLRRSGGFDETMRKGEDVDLAWRLLATGHRARYEPDLVARHEPRATLMSWLAAFYGYGSSAGPLADRHGDAVAPAVATSLTVAVAAAMVVPNRYTLGAVALTAATTTRTLRNKLLPSPDRDRIALQMGRGALIGSAQQTLALPLRHWWPLAAALSPFSRHVRRFTLSAAVIDSALEYRRRSPDLDPVRFTLLRRAEEIAYGSGVWTSALRGRSWRALLPRRWQARTTG